MQDMGAASKAAEERRIAAIDAHNNLVGTTEGASG